MRIVKLTVLSILSLSLLVGCTSTKNKQMNYIFEGKPYPCEVVKQGNVFPTIKYLKDGEWIYTLAWDSDIVYLDIEDGK